MAHIVRAVVVLLGAGIVAAHALTPVEAVRSRHCSAMAPQGWAFAGESPPGSAFGTDVMRNDGAAVASYYIVGVPAEMRSSPWYGKWYATPHQAVLATLSRMGTAPIQCSAPSAPAPGLHLMQCRTPEYVGLALYQVFPMVGNGFVLVIRAAGTAPALWGSQGEIASAVARSIRCRVPLRPSSADYTSGLSGSGKSRRDKADSGYSRWLGMENYHDPRTGANYWVSPSTDWNQNCPQGPGYCVNAGGSLSPLEPGRSD